MYSLAQKLIVIHLFARGENRLGELLGYVSFLVFAVNLRGVVVLRDWESGGLGFELGTGRGGVRYVVHWIESLSKLWRGVLRKFLRVERLLLVMRVIQSQLTVVTMLMLFLLLF